HLSQVQEQRERQRKRKKAEQNPSNCARLRFVLCFLITLAPQCFCMQKTEQNETVALLLLPLSSPPCPLCLLSPLSLLSLLFPSRCLSSLYLSLFCRCQKAHQKLSF